MIDGFIVRAEDCMLGLHQACMLAVFVIVSAEDCMSGLHQASMLAVFVIDALTYAETSLFVVMLDNDGALCLRAVLTSSWAGLPCSPIKGHALPSCPSSCSRRRHQASR